MYRSIRFIALTVLVLAIAATMAFGQSPITFPIFMQGTAAADTATVVVGWNPGPPDVAYTKNTYAPDLTPDFGPFMELLSPPAPPPGWSFWGGFYDAPSRAPGNPIATISSGTGMQPYNFVGLEAGRVDSFQIRLTGNEVATAASITITWPAGLSTILESARLQKRVGASWATVVVPNMLTTTSYVEDNSVAGASTINYLLIAQPKIVSVGPLFAATPSSVAFGNVQGGMNSDVTVTVSNGGTTNPLIVTGVAVGSPFSIVSPAVPFTVPAGGSQAVVVRFASAAPGGLKTGSIVFTSNALNGPTNTVAVSGTTVLQGGSFDFKNTAITVLDNSTGIYTNTLSFTTLVGAPLNALEFTLTTNGKIAASAVRPVGVFATAAWSVSMVPTRGIPGSDGTSVDSWKILLYANGTSELLASAAPIDVFEFDYNVVNISVDQTSTTCTLSGILGSTDVAGSYGLNTTATQTITINNRTIAGDINEDDRVDILDLLLIVDHITGKRLIPNPSNAFTAADIADVANPTAWPAADGAVNVLDLVRLQNIILAGTYPTVPPTPIYKTATVAVTSLAKTAPVSLKAYVSKNRVTVITKSEVSIAGIQFLMGNATSISDPVSAVFSTVGAKLNGNMVTALMYSLSIKPLAAGEFAVFNANCQIQNPSFSDVIIVDADGNKLAYTAEVVLGEPPVIASLLPGEMKLDQNYPNPFNPMTQIRVSIKEAGPVRIAIYNMLGQEVRTLFAGQMEAGVRDISFDGKDASGRSLSTGTYIYRMVAGSFVDVKKMLLMK